MSAPRGSLAGSSVLHLPAGPWRSVLDCLCERFPAIDRQTWLERMARGRVLDAEGIPLDAAHPYREGLRVHYFREVAQEVAIPFEEQVLHVDEHLVVADKPHFLPVIPSGGYVEQTLLARLIRRLGNPQLVPIHRIDRLTAGLVLFSANPDSRAAYQALFRQRSMHKRYEAIGAAPDGVAFPQLRRTRLVAAEPFFLMREGEGEGEANSETRIELLERKGSQARYRLYPLTGKKHQLRVHLAALGAGIDNDPFYPRLTPYPTDDYRRPLKLLAQALAFDDPLSGERRTFESRLRLDW